LRVRSNSNRKTRSLLSTAHCIQPFQRLEARGSIRASWGTSDNNRRARFYELTTAGRKQPVVESRQWRRLAFAIGRILGPEEA
jgi:DNA-binding MarR family transcriptional regulator